LSSVIKRGNEVRVRNKMEGKTFGKDLDKIPSQEKL